MQIKAPNTIIKFFLNIAMILGVFVMLVFPAGTFAAQLILTQKSSVVGVGQSLTIVAKNGSGLSVKSSSSVVRAAVKGNQITIQGKKAGSAKVNVCSKNFGCSQVSVKVQKNKDLSLKASKSKVNFSVGKSQTITIANGKNISTINSSRVVRVSVKGSIITIRGLSPGAANVMACSSNRGCLPINVQVSGSVVLGKVFKSEPPKVVLLNRTNVKMLAGTSEDIIAEKNSVSAKSDSESVRTAVNGNRITLYGMAPGTATVQICEMNICTPVHVKVEESNFGPFTVDRTTVALKTGESTWIQTHNTNKVSVTKSSSLVNVKTYKDLILISASSYTGSTDLRICRSVGECLRVKVNVKRADPIKLTSGSLKSISLNLGETKTVQIFKNRRTSYYLTNVSNPNVAEYLLNSTVSSTYITLKGLRQGSTKLKICPLMPGFSCGTIGVNVSNKPVCQVRSTGILRLNLESVQINEYGNKTVLASSCDLTAFSSNSEIAIPAVNEDRITIYGRKTGEAIITICNFKGDCADVEVNVVKS